MEVGMVNEELEVSKIHITKAVELVQGLAWEEVDAKDAWRKRMLDRIRAENPAMDEGMVALSTKQAEAGAGERIAQLDVSHRQTAGLRRKGRADKEAFST